MKIHEPTYTEITLENLNDLAQRVKDLEEKFAAHTHEIHTPNPDYGSEYYMGSRKHDITETKGPKTE